MINEETTKIAIEYLTELRDSRQKILPNKAPKKKKKKDMDIFNIAIKALHTVEIIKEELGPEYEENAIWFDVPHFEEIQERAEMRVKHDLGRRK